MPKAFQSIVDSSTNTIDTYNLINPAAPRRLTPTMLLTALHEGHSKHNLLNLVKKSKQANYANNNSNSGKEGGSGRGGRHGRGRGRGGRGGQGRGRGSNRGSAYSKCKCYNCGRKGHYSKMCPSPKRDQANEATTDAKGKEEDKKKKDDKSKDAKLQQQQQQQAQSAFIEEITDKTAWSAQTDQHICIDAFDSSASLHLTPEKN
ncbi:hypothetical protein EW145_g911 [Phellinidium pouzarii]|uniref:CCHC-type domain-containing protein n=1 Tax=Phellinidium pouzarii TaxID=167371 RepID=A0A4S4LGL4_9AGAM|nr:hypothetical protein EW145_g911 [Phellinidium pouzarii]